MPIFNALPPNNSGPYELVVVGSGFGALFFVEGYIKKRPKARVLILERGRHNSDAWQLAQSRNSDISPASTFRSRGERKTWNFTIGLGGGTNCWYGQTPRLHPNDFRTRALYAVGSDWPFTYADLEPFYADAEERMSVSGSETTAKLFPRSTLFPLPPHLPTSVDRVMMAAQPDAHHIISTARASVATMSRTRCCSSARCNLCPVSAKFSFNNAYEALLQTASVDICLNSEVESFESSGGNVTSVNVLTDRGKQAVRGDLFVLGANAIHSPAILLRSNIRHPLTGLGINEQVGYGVEAHLDGLDNFDGSTITTALNYSLYDGPFRSQHAGALLYFENRWPYGLRPEPGRWRQIAPIVVVVEDLLQDENVVTIDSDGFPLVTYRGMSEYARAGLIKSEKALSKVLSPLPIERIEVKGLRGTESHIQGTLRMGSSRESGVVDGNLVHYDRRNLVVVGSSIFPTCPAANPSLTVAATSLRSAAAIA